MSSSAASSSPSSSSSWCSTKESDNNKAFSISFLLSVLILALGPLLPLFTWLFVEVPALAHVHLPNLRLWLGVPGLALASTVAFLVLALAYDSFAGRAPGQVPSPPSPLPFLGQSQELHAYRYRALDWLTMYSQRFGGKTWTFKVMFRPRVYVILSPENVEYILKTNFHNYGKGRMFRARMLELLGDGIFNVDGQRWYEQRKISSHLFTHRNFKQRMLSTITKDVRTLVDIVGGAVDKQAAVGAASEVNFSQLFLRYTLDAIGEIAFGKEIGALRGESADVVASFDYIQTFLNDLVLKPPGYAQYCRNFTPEGKRYADCLATLNAFVNGMVMAAKEQTTEEELAARGDLLALFLTRTDGDGRPFTIEYLRDIVVNMIIAGRDTTAYALAWTMWLLATHPEIQATARAEAQAAFALVAADGAQDLSYEAINDMPYLDAVFTEVLRLYPSVPKNPKCVFHDDTLPDGTQVKAGSYVMYVPYVMARLPGLWGEHPDAFDPSRHLHGRHRPSPYLWPAFQAGPRTCLGQKLAYMEAKAVLAALLANFEFEPSASVPEPRLVQNALTTSMEGQGLVLVVNRVGEEKKEKGGVEEKSTKAGAQVPQ